MNELLDLEPRETDADEIAVDTAFSRIADPAHEADAGPYGCGDDLSHWYPATATPSWS